MKSFEEFLNEQVQVKTASITKKGAEKENLSESIQDEIKAIEAKIEAIHKDGGRVALNDPLSKRLNQLRALAKTQKK